ncbi:MAG: acyltransferase [Crenarchaeota archaeon]|nr:acyltransferase [Thermoproteota archaeon]
MNVIIPILKWFYHCFLRNTYWLYCLSNISGIRYSSVNLPVIVEGKGKISLGKKSKLASNSKLYLASNSQLLANEAFNLAKNAEIRITGESNLKIGSNFSLGERSRIFVNNNWVFEDYIVIATNCAIFSRESGYQGTLQICNGTHIGDNTIVDVSDNINIGKDVAIGPNCVIYTHDHDYKSHGKPAWKGGVITKPVKIEEGAWIGSGVTILPGVTIGERAVVAAGAVVIKDVDPKTVVGGVPAKLIKNLA